MESRQCRNHNAGLARELQKNPIACALRLLWPVAGQLWCSLVSLWFLAEGSPLTAPGLAMSSQGLALDTLPV